MQRSGNEKVPGCDTGPSNKGQDYCYKPDRPDNGDGEDDIPSAGNLGRVGNNGQPSSVFPLEKCHGDCDSDGKSVIPKVTNNWYLYRPSDATCPLLFAPTR